MSGPVLARRGVLRGLAAAPVAFVAAGAPVAALAAISPSAASPDDPLKRLAARVVRLARIEERLCLQVADIEEGIEDPPYPKQPPAEGVSCAWSDDRRTFTTTFETPFHAQGGPESPAWTAYEKAKEARERECIRLREAAGLPAIEARREMALERLVAATEALTAMPCVTIEDFAAKARAWLAIDKGGSDDEWTQDLAASIVKGLAEIGGEHA